MIIRIHTDGGSRGNPGPAAIGVVIEEVKSDTGEVIRQIQAFGKKIGETTNNVAEYTAVVEALMYVQNHIRDIVGDILETSSITCYLDSLLVVNQLNGLFKIKETHLRNFLFRVRSLEQTIGLPVSYTHVPRNLNSAADAQVNNALDS
jgi:ribonuclease HI